MIISPPKHFHLYKDFVNVCSRLGFGAYIYLDNFNAFLILISENQILKLSSAVVESHLFSTKTLSV